MDKTPQNQNSKNAAIESATIADSLKTTDNASRGEETTMKRRRALIAGLAAVPVLITLKSRSAFAANPSCSILLSISLEAHPSIPVSQLTMPISTRKQDRINVMKPVPQLTMPISTRKQDRINVMEPVPQLAMPRLTGAKTPSNNH